MTTGKLLKKNPNLCIRFYGSSPSLGSVCL